MNFLFHVKGSIDGLPPIKELDNGDPNRPRSPESFLGGAVVQTDALGKPTNVNMFETNIVETSAQGESTNIPEKNNEDKQISSEDSEEDSDDDIVVAAGNFTLSSMENSLPPNTASPSTAGINLKRNNLLTLSNIPGMSSGSKVRKQLNLISVSDTFLLILIYIFSTRENSMLKTLKV